MPLNNRKRVLLAKIESVYGTDPTPTGIANAIQVRNLTVTPQDADFVDRELVRPYFGRSEQLAAGIRVRVAFQCEMVGGGTAGQAPALSPLFRACGFAETLTAAAVTGVAQAGAASTITLAAAGTSAVDDFYNGMPIRITGGTGSGSAGIVIDYNGTSKLATVAAPWAVAPAASSNYSIDANAVYRPVTDSIASATLYINVDGVLHRLLGARGSVSMAMRVKDIPTFDFEFTGIYQAVTDAAAPTPVYTGFPTPVTVSNVNTVRFSLHSFGAVMSEMSINLSNEVVHRTLVGGSEAVLVTDRQPQGNITIEATTVAQKDWWVSARDAVLGSLALEHGLVAGRKVVLSAPSVQLTSPQYSDLDGITMLGMGLNLVPLAGNDEINIGFA